MVIVQQAGGAARLELYFTDSHLSEIDGVPQPDFPASISSVAKFTRIGLAFIALRSLTIHLGHTDLP